MKYRMFNYSSGYMGTEVKEAFAFSDSYTEKEIEENFEEWYQEQRRDNGYIEECSENEEILDIYD